MKRSTLIFSLTIFFIFSFTCAVVFAGNPTKQGDVVARYLQGDTYFSFGHVGIFMLDNKNNKKILEVFDTGISTKYSLDDFKSATKYVGAKYQGKGTSNQLAIIKAGTDQQTWSNKNGFIYLLPQASLTTLGTLIPKYREGQMGTRYIWNSKKKAFEQKSVAVQSEFRCDTFVNFAYKKGTGSHIVSMFSSDISSPVESDGKSYNSAPGYIGYLPWTPAYLYNSMSSSR